MSFFPGLNTAIRLPFRQKLAVCHVAALFAAAEVVLRTSGVERAMRVFRVPLASNDAGGTCCVSTAPAFVLSDGERRMVKGVLLVSPHVYGSTRGCLRRSLVLGYSLRRHDPRLVMGVRREGVGVVAHAWLDVQGVLVGADDRFEAFVG